MNDFQGFIVFFVKQKIDTQKTLTFVFMFCPILGDTVIFDVP